jgi:hypothetical protein
MPSSIRVSSLPRPAHIDHPVLFGAQLVIVYEEFFKLTQEQLARHGTAHRY